MESNSSTETESYMPDASVDQADVNTAAHAIGLAVERMLEGEPGVSFNDQSPNLSSVLIEIEDGGKEITIKGEPNRNDKNTTWNITSEEKNGDSANTVNFLTPRQSIHHISNQLRNLGVLE